MAKKGERVNISEELVLQTSGPDIKSSAGEINSFMESSLHEDFLSELDFRIALYKEYLVDSNVELSGREYDVLRGFVTNLRHTKDVFNMLYEAKGEKEAEETINEEKQNGKE